MAAAANMLAAIGGTPRLKNLDPGFPRAGLPGGVEPDLHVGLARLSRGAREHASRFSWSATVDKLLGMYGAVMSEVAAAVDA